MWSQQRWVERKDHFPWSAGNTLPNATWVLLAFFATRAHYWITFHLLSTKLCCYKDAFQMVSLLCAVEHGAFTRYRTLHFLFWNFMKFPSAYFSGLSTSLWTAAQLSGLATSPPSFVSSANTLKVHLQDTGLQLDSVTLITNLWAQQFSQFSIHLHCLLIQPILHQLISKDVIKNSA